MSEEYTLDDLDDAKEALNEMHTIFKEKIASGELKNEGYNDGASKQYSYGGVTVVQVFDEMKKEDVVSTVFYEGSDWSSEEFANIEFDGSTNLDSEFEEDINKVMNVYTEFKEAVDIDNAMKAKTEAPSTETPKVKSPKNM